MSGHGANPIFFNKKNKDWTSRTLANPPPPHPTMSDNISILPYLPPRMCTPLTVSVTYLIKITLFNNRKIDIK